MKNMNKYSVPFLLLVTSGLGLSSLSMGADPVEIPCGVIVKASHGTQMIPPQGKVQVKLQVDQPVVCGAMIITHTEGVWIRHSNQSVYKIAPDSFFELGKDKADANRLFRGELLVTAPPSSKTDEFVTLNAKVKFNGGVAWIRYNPKEKETVAASFNRTFTFVNKFNEKAAQEVRVAEMSRLKLGDARVVPTQPEVIDAPSVKDVVSHFDLTETDQKEMSNLVERVYETRSKALVADIEDWKKIEEDQTRGPSRSIASVKKAKPAVDEEEAAHTLSLFKQKVFGEEDLHLLNDDRKPASVTERLPDPGYEKSKKKKAAETKKVMKEISDLKTD